MLTEKTKQALFFLFIVYLVVGTVTGFIYGAFFASPVGWSDDAPIEFTR